MENRETIIHQKCVDLVNTCIDLFGHNQVADAAMVAMNIIQQLLLLTPEAEAILNNVENKIKESANKERVDHDR